MNDSFAEKLASWQEQLQRGQAEELIEQLQSVNSTSLSSSVNSKLENLLGVAKAQLGLVDARAHFQHALELDTTNASAQMNLELIKADQFLAKELKRDNEKERPTRIAVLSFLFNWPSTGGGIVHTVELCDFLQRAGYLVEHFYARYDAWELGVVTQQTPMKSQVLNFRESEWNARTIQQRYRQAVDAFDADYVIITDSWNMKPVLAQAMQGYLVILRLQALECLCPLNNIRLLPADGGGFRQCTLHQLATPSDCHQCLNERGQRSGSLHQAERQLAGVGTPEYHATLTQAFKDAHAVLVVNPLTEAMVAPYSTRVRTVTAGMDPARFPDPWPQDPAPSSDRPKKQILFAGLVDETIKGFNVLHDACQLLWQERQDFELLVTADPIGQIDSFTRTVGWQTQQNLPNVMRSVDMVAVPAIAQEALGRTAVEAMAAGRPVVASRLGGLPFTIPDGATGLLFEPGDALDLAAKLTRLLNNIGLRHTLGESGRRRFIEHYAWPAIIEKHYLPILGTSRLTRNRNPK